MKLVIITLEHEFQEEIAYWWDNVLPVDFLDLQMETKPPFTPDEFPRTIALTKRVVQVGTHQIVLWTYPKFHGAAKAPEPDVTEEIQRRAQRIYKKVLEETPCAENDAIIVHERSYPKNVVPKAYSRPNTTRIAARSTISQERRPMEMSITGRSRFS